MILCRTGRFFQPLEIAPQVFRSSDLRLLIFVLCPLFCGGIPHKAFALLEIQIPMNCSYILRVWNGAVLGEQVEMG